jgi:hypothetical protein
LVVVADEKTTLPSWKAVKAALQSFDRAGLLGLVQDLYAVDKGNKAFLNARLGLGSGQLAPYKAIRAKNGSRRLGSISWSLKRLVMPRTTNLRLKSLVMGPVSAMRPGLFSF